VQSLDYALIHIARLLLLNSGCCLLCLYCSWNFCGDFVYFFVKLLSGWLELVVIRNAVCSYCGTSDFIPAYFFGDLIFFHSNFSDAIPRRHQYQKDMYWSFKDHVPLLVCCFCSECCFTGPGLVCGFHRAAFCVFWLDSLLAITSKTVDLYLF